MSRPDRYGVNPDEPRRADIDAFDALIAADPVNLDEIPGPDSPQARALYEEITMERSATLTPRRLALAGGLAAAVAAAAIGVVALTGDTPAQPEGGDPIVAGPGPGMALCVEMYDLDTLTGREVAFDATLTAVAGDQATFEVHEVFAGDIGSSVTLDGAEVLGAGETVSSVGSGTFTVGDRMLVSGDGGFAWSCGFTQPYSQDLADQWRQAFS